MGISQQPPSPASMRGGSDPYIEVELRLSSGPLLLGKVLFPSQTSKILDSLLARG